jgi:hypothetical protein
MASLMGVKCRRTVVVFLLLIGSIHAQASEEFESLGGKVVEVKSQEELASLADGECAAISNAGILNLNNVRIYGNTASNYSAIRILREGRVNMGKDVKIFDNNAPQDVHSEGVLNMDLS